MKQITLYEAMHTFLRIWTGDKTPKLAVTVIDYMQQFKAPTFDEVVMAWEETINEKRLKPIEVIIKDEGLTFSISVRKSNGRAIHTFYRFYKYNLKYERFEVYGFNNWDTPYSEFNAINLTIRYLQDQVKEND